MTRQLAVVLLTLALVYGCSQMGTVVVSYSTEATISASDSKGRLWSIVPRDFLQHRSLDSGEGTAGFSSILDYRGKEFSGSFWVGSEGVSGRLFNRSERKICIYFERAKVQSSFAPESADLRVLLPLDFKEQLRAWSVLGNAQYSRRYQEMTARGSQQASTFCVDSGSDRYFTLAIDFKNVYRSAKMFGVQWEKSDPALHEKGIGAWLKLIVPVTYGDMMQEVEVNLIAKDVKARKTHY